MGTNIVRAKVAVLGRKVEEFVSEGPCTVEQALRPLFDVVPEADIRLNGKPTSLSAPMTDGDIIAVVPKIQGG
jgi:molybdopterin converting factor small subunit